MISDEKQFIELEEALLNAFDDQQEFGRVIRNAGIRMTRIIAPTDTMEDVVEKAVKRAVQNNSIDKLVIAAQKARPDNIFLIEYAEKYLGHNRDIITPPFLPPLPVKFVSRNRNEKINEDLLDLLKQVLMPTSLKNLVLLNGPGGAGKTAAAQEAVQFLSKQYHNRVIWVDATNNANLGKSEIINEIIKRFNSRASILKIEDREQKAASLISEAPALIVIDDFETIPPKEQYDCYKWLITNAIGSLLFISRDAFVTIEDQIQIHVKENISDMTAEEAKEFWNRLVTERAQHKHIFKDYTPEKIIKKYGTNPFILFKGVFSYVNAYGDWEELDDNVVGDNEEVEQRIFIRSFNLEKVGDTGRTILLALSLFTPHASREALAYVSNLQQNSKQFRDSIAILKSLWLIVPAMSLGRWAMDKTYRRYAKKHMENQSIEPKPHGRFVDYFANYVESHSQTTPSDFLSLEQEKDNILEALNIAQTINNYSGVVKIYKVLGRQHNGFFEVRGYWDIALKYGELARKAAREENQKELFEAFTCTVAGLYLKKFDFKSARELLKPLVDDNGRSVEKQSYINALHLMGMMGFIEGKFEDAKRFFEKELSISNAAGSENVNQRGLANCTHELARIERIQGNLEESRKLFEQSLEIRDKFRNSDGSKDISALQSPLHDLGILEQQQGELTQLRGDNESARKFFFNAMKSYAKSLKIKRVLRNNSSIAHTLTEAGDLARLKARLADSEKQKSFLYKKSEERLERSIKIKEGIVPVDKLHIAFSNYILGKLEVDRGSLDKAQQYYNKSASVYERHENQPGIASCNYLQGLIAEKAGNLSLASEQFNKALSYWEGNGMVAAELARLALKRISNKPL